MKRAMNIKERELKMVKKSLIAIALMSMLASTSFAGDLASKEGYWKFDDFWPIEVVVNYEVLELCQIPIFIDVGMYIELENCGKLGKGDVPILKIILEQISCANLDSETTSEFPCYRGCQDIRVRSNFEAILGLKLYKKDLGGGTYFIGNTGGWGARDKWNAFFDDVDTVGVETLDEWTVPGDGNWEKVKVCVEAWDVNIFYGDPESKPTDEVNRVGEVAITVVPAADPDYCVLCP
jgi:hypothetical protein